MVLALILAVIAALYLFPGIYETEFLIFSFKFFNFFIFFSLALYLVVAVKLSKLQSFSLVILISLLLQILQSTISVREIGLETIFYNFLGATLGVYGIISTIYLVKIIFLLINKLRRYQSEYSDTLESITDLNDIYKKPNPVIKYLRYILRYCHFAFNTTITPEDNIKISIKTDLPHKMIFPVMSPLIIRHLLQGTFEKDTSVILSEQISSGMVIWDIGAHYGYFSLKASCLVGDKGKILSFEPTPTTFKMLHENTKNIPNISIFNVAFFSQNIQLTFNDYGENFSALNSLYEPRVDEDIKYQKRYLVNFLKADDFILDNNLKPDLIKMDCESSELEILKGMTNILLSYQPSIIMEFGDLPNKDIPRSKPIIEFLHSKNYRAFRRFKEGYTEIKLQEIYPYFNILFVHTKKIPLFVKNNPQI